MLQYVLPSFVNFNKDILKVFEMLIQSILINLISPFNTYMHGI